MVTLENIWNNMLNGEVSVFLVKRLQICDSDLYGKSHSGLPSLVFMFLTI